MPDTIAVRVYGPEGEYRDEGGNYKTEHKTVPSWVPKAQRHCVGCHDDFYNGRDNGGFFWCWNLKPGYARRKTKPPCWHR